MKATLVAFFVGLIFALGLGLAGMIQPEKIIGFLDVAGRWDPDLLLVMVGAITVTFFSYRLIYRRVTPIVVRRFYLPENKRIDSRLMLGAALFGIGWGLGGFCPGPALVSLLTGAPSVGVFVLSMLVGMKLFQWQDQMQAHLGHTEKRETPGGHPPRDTRDCGDA